LLKVRPCLARGRDWFPQVVAAVTLQYDAGDRQAVSVVERVVAIAVSAPPPIAQTVGGWWVALDAEFSARGMGTSKLRLRKTDPLPRTSRATFRPLAGSWREGDNTSALHRRAYRSCGGRARRRDSGSDRNSRGSRECRRRGAHSQPVREAANGN